MNQKVGASKAGSKSLREPEAHVWRFGGLPGPQNLPAIWQWLSCNVAPVAPFWACCRQANSARDCHSVKTQAAQQNCRSFYTKTLTNSMKKGCSWCFWVVCWELTFGFPTCWGMNTLSHFTTSPGSLSSLDSWYFHSIYVFHGCSGSLHDQLGWKSGINTRLWGVAKRTFCWVWHLPNCAKTNEVAPVNMAKFDELYLVGYPIAS